jgi:ribosomal protein L37AE/L43A
VWHDELKLEIEVEFQRLSAPHWERIESWTWIGLQIGYRDWAEHGVWWRKTGAGKRYFAAYAKARATRLKRIIVGIRKCRGCGKPFHVSAYRVGRKRSNVCSPSCRGRSRQNIKRYTIDGKTRTLTEWCGLRGVPLSRVWARMKRGWNVRDALNAPLRGAA